MLYQFKPPTPNAGNQGSITREDSTDGDHQMVHTEIRLIVFFAVIDVEAPFSQQMYDKRAINTYTETSGLNWQSSSRVWHSI